MHPVIIVIFLWVFFFPLALTNVDRRRVLNESDSKIIYFLFISCVPS